MARVEPDALLLCVEVVFSPGPRVVLSQTLQLPVGATVRDAVRRAQDCNEALQQQAQATPLEALRVGIWGRLSGWSHVLRDQDRIELYRPLLIDPKESRRLRFKKQRPAKRRGR